MEMPVVDVVDVVTVRDGDVAASFAVLMVMRCVLSVCLGHLSSLVRSQPLWNQLSKLTSRQIG